MPKFDPEKASLKTPELISKYLYYLEFVETVSPHTRIAYENDLRQAFHPETVEPTPGWEKLTKLDKVTEEALLLQCRLAIKIWAPLSPASRNRKIATLKSFLGWLHRIELIERNLGTLLVAPKVPRRLPNFLSADEAIALIEAVKNWVKTAEPQEHLVAERTLLLIALLYGGGLRVSEACQLTWRQVDFNSRILRIRGKGDKERQVPLPGLSFTLLKRHGQKETDYVWGKAPLSTREAYNRVRDAGVRARLLKPLHPHALRHSFATHLLTSGANLRTLQELLGHESLQATERYTHLSLDQLARTMEKFHPLSELPAPSSVRKRKK